MPNRDVTVKGKETGLDISKVSIYRDSISTTNLIAVVPKSVFMEGYSFSDDDQQEDYVVQADDPCRTVINLSLRATNQPPTVTITGATSSSTNTNVTLTADANDPEGLPMTYLWSTGETTETITVTSATAQTSNYTVTVTDDLGETATDSHSIVWSVPTTTQPPAPTTAPPTPFAQITGVTAAQINDTITLTGEDYNFTGSTWAWTGGAAAGLTSKVINITETSAGTVTYGVTVDGTYTDTHDVTWQAEPTTTTTTTTTTSTTTTTTTTASPETYNRDLSLTEAVTDNPTYSITFTDTANTVNLISTGSGASKQAEISLTNTSVTVTVNRTAPDSTADDNVTILFTLRNSNNVLKSTQTLNVNTGNAVTNQSYTFTNVAADDTMYVNISEG